MQTNPLTYHGKYILNWLIEVQILQKTGALFPYNLKRWSERIKSQIYKDINIFLKKKKYYLQIILLNCSKINSSYAFTLSFSFPQPRFFFPNLLTKFHDKFSSI